MTELVPKQSLPYRVPTVIIPSSQDLEKLAAGATFAAIRGKRRGEGMGWVRGGGEEDTNTFDFVYPPTPYHPLDCVLMDIRCPKNQTVSNFYQCENLPLSLIYEHKGPSTVYINGVKCIHQLHAQPICANTASTCNQNYAIKAKNKTQIRRITITLILPCNVNIVK